jgi:hypothetical protein
MFVLGPTKPNIKYFAPEDFAWKLTKNLENENKHSLYSVRKHFLQKNRSK